eukprot:CAMPEP_0201585108 /NCGR_PEP_ID=MMETSP0190_2-20130828/118219_1 /ASSEMBLY_ACC=CAM_ASM_000263 /TAXON_ID=37353 /ORGANISM="Rosalina sp." /LENGTH=66 /DNA_ID=CAMNT_0048030383 /DNA_START=8 /DNA_END=204 /DNA_ORIENTATION=+
MSLFIFTVLSALIVSINAQWEFCANYDNTTCNQCVQAGCTWCYSGNICESDHAWCPNGGTSISGTT